MKRAFLYILTALTVVYPVTGMPFGAGTPGAAFAAPGSGEDGTPEDEIEEDIEDRVEEDIEGAFEDDIEDSIEADIEDSVEDDVEDGIESAIEDSVESTVEDAVEDDVEDSVEDAIEDGVENNIENNIEDDVESGIEGSVEARVEDKVSDKIDSKIEDMGTAGKAAEHDFEDELEDRFDTKFDDSGDDEGRFDEIKVLAKAERDTTRAAADAERNAMRSAARALRNAALAAPGADEEAVNNSYEIAKQTADESREQAREEADQRYESTLAIAQNAEEGEEDSDSGSDDEGAGSDDEGDEEGDEQEDDESASGSSNSGSSGNDGSEDEADDDDSEDESSEDGEDETDDDESDGSGKSSAPSRAGVSSSLSSASSENKMFAVGFDDAGNEIVRHEWLILASRDTIDGLSAKGLATEEMESLDGLGLILARIRSTDQFTIKEHEAMIMEAAPDAKVDYNHVYFKHNYRTGTKSTRTERHGSAPSELFNLPAIGGGKGHSIGIIDTSIDVAHASLKNAQIHVEDFVPYEHVRPETHGTSVASILAGQSKAYRGLLPQADIFAASVFFNSPTGVESATTLSLVRALDWMTKNNVSVVNMSLTGPPNAILKSAIDRAYDNGTIVVAAVGNEGPSAAPLYPAAYDKVIAVTAVTKKKKIYRLANRGDYVDFAAPGVNVKHAVDHGDFASSSGTSMAAPFVTAVLALSTDADGRISEEQLKALATKAEDLGREGFDPVYGYGLIQPLGD